MDDSSTQSKINLSTALPCPRNVAIFTYQPLDASGSLRLLKVQPDTLDGFLQIELEEITDSTPYHCLSYMWGDQTTRFPIRLNGQAAHVGKNLYNFLKVAKRRFPGEAFWIDSLCINQADDHEKSSQVQRMGSIYRDATDVIIWFGDHEGISALFEWLGRPQHAISRVMHHLSSKIPPAHLRRSIQDLAYHPYWTRAWVQQEMLLSRSTRLLCGNIEISPEELSRCGEGTILEMGRRDFYALTHLSIQVRHLTSAKYRGPKSFWSLATPGLNGKILQCADPRDRIYSLLSLTGQDKAFRVDYQEHLVDLFCRSVHHFTPGLVINYMRTRWDILELTPDMFREAVATRGIALQFHVHMRRTKIIPDVKRQLKGAFTFQRNGLCAHDPVRSVRARISGYSSKCVLLCPGTDTKRFNGDHDFDNIHILLCPIKPALADAFTFSLHSSTYGRLHCPMDIELWSTANGVENVVTKWTDVRRIVSLGETSCKDEDELSWRAKPHFVLKLSHRFVLESLNHMQRFWDWKHGSSLQYRLNSFWRYEWIWGNRLSQDENRLRALAASQGLLF